MPSSVRKLSFNRPASVTILLLAAACSSASVGDDEGDAGPDVRVSTDTGAKDTGAHDSGKQDSAVSHDAGHPEAAVDAGVDSGADAHVAGDTGTDAHAEADAGFDASLPFPALPDFDGQINALLHVGSSWFVGGDFSRIGGDPAPAAFALTTAGAADTSCLLGGGFDDSVVAVVVSGSSLFVGGYFANYKGVPAGGLAKLDATTCALDPTFKATFSSPFGGGDVWALAVSGTSLFVGGQFSDYGGVSNAANNLAKLDTTTGAIDTTFSPVGATANGFGQPVQTIVVSGSSIFVGGELASYRGTTVGGLSKIDSATGALDATFPAVTLNGNVFALTIVGTSLYAGGNFFEYENINGNVVSLAKLDVTTGALDTTFSPLGDRAFLGVVQSLAATETSLYVGGDIPNYRGATVPNNLIKVDLTTGALDTTFSPPGPVGFDDRVYALAVSGTNLYAAGGFTSYNGVAGSANRIAKLDLTTGAIDDTFTLGGSNANGFDGEIDAITVLPSGALFVGGQFDAYGGTVANGIAKFDDMTFAVDPSFFGTGLTNGFDGSVAALATSGTSLYVGGRFSTYEGVASSANNLAKLDLTTGALDTAFSPPGGTTNGFDEYTTSLLAVGGSLYVGGGFDAYRGASANELAKLDLTTGALDTTFSPPGANGFDQEVDAFATDGTSLYVTGQFSAYRNVASSANAIAKLDLTSGAIDTTFSPPGPTTNGFEGQGAALLVSGTSLYVGGSFIAYRGVANSALYLAKLDLTTGAQDTTFSPPGATTNGFDNGVNALFADSTSLYVGGYFSAYRGVALSANGIAKLDSTTGVQDTTFGAAGASSNGFGTGEDRVVDVILPLGTSLLVGGFLPTYRGVPVAGNLVVLGKDGALE